jgi:hypothetical protein
MSEYSYEELRGIVDKVEANIPILAAEQTRIYNAYMEEQAQELIRSSSIEEQERIRKTYMKEQD